MPGSSFSFIEPMKALPVEKLPEGDWLYEIKFDGYRALAFKDGKDVRLVILAPPFAFLRWFKLRTTAFQALRFPRFWLEFF
jgi:hypothetical protein